MSISTVTVTGLGTASVRPDSAVVRAAAVARAAGVAEAFAGCTAAAAAMGGVARRHTAADRVTTTGINVWPWHDHEGQPRGFEARHAMSMSCGDLAAAGALLDELATEIGDALVVEGIALEVSSSGAAQEQAVTAAYDDAVRQATQLAGLAGGSLGEVLSLGHSGSLQAAPGHDEAMAMSAKIEPGEARVSASLAVTWALVLRATAQDT